jgi:hypothetical protein
MFERAETLIAHGAHPSVALEPKNLRKPRYDTVLQGLQRERKGTSISSFFQK